jgi:hypothetical protein
LEHPTEYGGPDENLWILKNGTIFYFLDPKYKLYIATQSASNVKPEIEAKPDVKAQEPAITEHKKLTRAEKKAIRKAARKPAIEWADMEPNDESTTEFNQDAKHTTEDVPTAPKASTGTIVDMSTKSAWAAKVKTAEQAAKQTVPVKADHSAKQTVPVAEDFPELKAEQSKAEQPKAEQSKAEQSKSEQSKSEQSKAQDEQSKKLYMQQSTETQAQQPPDEPNAPQAEQPNAPQAEQQANENKFSSTLQYITGNFLEANFDPEQFALLQTSLQAEFKQMTAQITLLKEQVFKLHRLQKAYAGYHSKD